MADWERLSAAGRRQYGLITITQLAACGFSRHQVGRMTAAGELERVRLGVYRLCGSPPSWRASAMAAVLTAGAPATLSHGSAAALWGLVDRHGTGPLELSAARKCRQPGIVTHVRELDPSERTSWLGIPVTSVARTLVDVAGRFDAGPLGELVDDALRGRLTTLSHLRRALAATPPSRRYGRGRAGMAEVLAARGPGYHPGDSRLELEMDRWFDASGLPPAVRQYPVRVGGHRYRLDRAIPSLKVAIEWNGRAYHGTRAAFEYDSDRRARLQAAGWRVLDFHYRSDPALIVRAVSAVCDERRGQNAGAARRGGRADSSPT